MNKSQTDPNSWYYFFTQAWRNINVRCAHAYANQVLVEFTHEEFKDWCETKRDQIERIQRKATKLSQRASIDRINSWGNYSLDNIQILTVRKNCQKGSRNP